MKRAVLGMGITLMNNWQIVKEKFAPDFAVDNNPAKWNTKDNFTGLECVPLDSIKNPESIEVLITAGDPYAIEAISRQLDEKHITYLVLLQMIDEWCKELPLPDDINDIQREDHKILLLNTPEHDNIGDHLIAVSEINLIKKLCSERAFFEITDMEYLWYKNRIKQRVSSDDLIIITGGGFMGSLWLYNTEDNIRNVLEEYPENRIVIFPQTVYFENNERGKKEYQKSVAIYRKHKNLTICAREKQSYDMLVNMVGSSEKIRLLPDMALFYDAIDFSTSKRDRILYCFRQDKESVLDEQSRQCIVEILNKTDADVLSTSMHEGVFDKKKRKTQVDKKLYELSTAKLVVTDTLHCMVSAALVGTACIFFDNLSGKVRNVYKWIDNNEYLHYCSDVADFKKIFNEITYRDNRFVLNKKSEYEERIRKIIEEA